MGSFLSVFMVRLGATDFQVGLLTAMPALTGMLLAMPAGEFLSRQRHIVGQMFTWFNFPLNYQVVFIGSAACGTAGRIAADYAGDGC